MSEYEDFDDDNRQPDEPDWDRLVEALEDAENWLMSEDGLDQENCIVRTEAVSLMLAILHDVKANKDCDSLVRTFFEHANRAAFWLVGSCKPPLQDWVGRFCVAPEDELQRMRKINAIADTKGEA
jgi:hypothetical protein